MESSEHGLMSYYPVIDGPDQLDLNKILIWFIRTFLYKTFCYALNMHTNIFIDLLTQLQFASNWVCLDMLKYINVFSPMY